VAAEDNVQLRAIVNAVVRLRVPKKWELCSFELCYNHVSRQNV
jgi:hypothetical protein